MNKQAPQKRATIWDVAKLAGVSQQTVSRYLRQDSGMKPQTVEKVKAAISELNYRPNRIAQSMRTRRTDRVGVFIPAANKRLPIQTLVGISAVAHDMGYAIDIIGVEGGEGRSDRILELTDSGDFDGVLALASFGGEWAQQAHTPVVVLADYDDELRGLGEVANGAACGEVVRHLYDQGHRNFLHIAGHEDFPAARNRRKTFTETVAALDATGEVVSGGWTAEAGYEAASRLRADTPVTAIVAANDAVALGAVRACLERGWDVPGYISVFGWDNNELCQFTTPTLSTVSVDNERLGRNAMRRLVAIMRGLPTPEPGVEPMHQLLPRESSGPVRTGR